MRRLGGRRRLQLPAPRAESEHCKAGQQHRIGFGFRDRGGEVDADDEIVEIGGNRTETVKKDEKITINGKRDVEVKKDDTLKVVQKLMIDAGQEITLKSGAASIVLKADGSITISGGKINIKGTGDVTVRAPKIAQN